MFQEIFGGGRGDAYTFSYMTSPVSILLYFGNNKLEMSREEWQLSIEFDGTSILSPDQD